MVKISTFIISLVVSSLFIGVFAIFLAASNQYYTIPNYNISRLETYNKLNLIAVDAQAIQNQTLAISEKSGVLDVIGSYFSDGYKALRITANSFGVFSSMLNTGIDDAQLGASGELIRVAIVVIVLILLFVGVLISAIVKRDL